MHINMMRYAGMAAKVGEAAPKVKGEFVPLLKGQPGFLGYAAFASEQGDIVALHLWEDSDALTGNLDGIRAWVSANMPEYAEPTERFRGDVGQHAIVSPQEGAAQLYCIIRKAENLPPDEPDRAAVETALLAAVQAPPGFRGAYYARSADDPTRGASVVFADSREGAAAAHEASLAIMRERRPQTTVRVAASGPTSVLAF